MNANSNMAARLGPATLPLILAAALAGCHREETNTSAPASDFERQGNLVVIPEKSPLRSRLVFDTARADKIQRELAAPAVVEAYPQKFARVFPPLSGHLEKLFVQLGDEVTEGQLVATLDSPDFAAARGDYVKAKSALRLARHALNRQHDLADAKIAATKDVEQAQTDFDNAESELDAAASRLRAFGFDPDKDASDQFLPVRSPVSGKVVDITAANREFRNDNTTPLFTIADLSTVWLTADEQERDLRFLKKDQEIVATLEAYPGELFKGRVLFVGDIIAPDTRTAKVRIAFANSDGRLKPGMFATVKVLGFPEMLVTVPTTAVVQVGQSAFVFEQVKPRTFQPREVTLGRQEGDRIVITKGLESGASILAKEGVLFR